MPNSIHFVIRKNMRGKSKCGRLWVLFSGQLGVNDSGEEVTIPKDRTENT